MKTTTALPVLALSALALFTPACARAVAEPGRSVQLEVPGREPVGAELRAQADAAVLLIESGKLMPLVDALRALGPEPDPAEAAATIERVLRAE